MFEFLLTPELMLQFGLCALQPVALASRRAAGLRAALRAADFRRSATVNSMHYLHKTAANPVGSYAAMREP
jgi:hypothetical protein